jgi:hypothetical protein
VDRNLVGHSLITVMMLICEVTCSVTGNISISVILTDFAFIVGFHVTYFRFWIAMAVEGGSFKPPIMVDGGFVAAAIVEDDPTVSSKSRLIGLSCDTHGPDLMRHMMFELICHRVVLGYQCDYRVYHVPRPTPPW